MTSNRVDDPSIGDGVTLYRRVHPDFLVHDDNRDCIRLSTGAFQQEEMSVALGDDLEQQGAQPTQLLAEYPSYALVSIKARHARVVDQAVCRDHLPDDATHGLVVGRKRGSVQRSLARAAKWVVPPEDACIPPYE